jgi:hypothetical protein
MESAFIPSLPEGSATGTVCSHSAPDGRGVSLVRKLIVGADLSLNVFCEIFGKRF